MKVAPSKAIKPKVHFVAIGQLGANPPEPIGAFPRESDAVSRAGEFMATTKFPHGAWVETIEVKPVSKERKAAK